MNIRQIILCIIIFLLGLLIGGSLLSSLLLGIDFQKKIELGLTLSPWISGLSMCATVAIALYAVLNYQLASTIRSRDDEFREDAKNRDQEFRQQLSDLFKAIVISNLLSRTAPGATRNGRMDNSIEEFNAAYKKAKGKTPIFRKGGD